jgi:hypothetical protein
MRYVSNAITALQDGGIRAERGYPAEIVPHLTGPVVAVTVEGSDQKQVLLGATVYGPGNQGGQACEELAQTVAQVLRQKRARCQVGDCHYDGESGLFSVKVTACWLEGLHNMVQIDNVILAYATEFSAVQTRQVQQVTDPQTGEKSVVNEEVIWTVAIQELLPFREIMVVDHKESFTLRVKHENCTEIYPECYWLSITLEETDGGLIRKRIARSWTERVIEE